jgi:hypothetical protein
MISAVADRPAALAPPAGALATRLGHGDVVALEGEASVGHHFGVEPWMTTTDPTEMRLDRRRPDAKSVSDHVDRDGRVGRLERRVLQEQCPDDGGLAWREPQVGQWQNPHTPSGLVIAEESGWRGSVRGSA